MDVVACKTGCVYPINMESLGKNFMTPSMLSVNKIAIICSLRKKNSVVHCSAQRWDENTNNSLTPRMDSNSSDVIEVVLPTSNKKLSDPNDIMKLFNDAQQNIIFLNKQRLMAIEELKKLHREKELLLARLGKAEAEAQSSIAECEVLKHKLNLIESRIASGGNWKLQNDKMQGKVKLDPSPIFGETLLRLDSMILDGAISIEQASEIRNLVIKKDSAVVETFSDLKHLDDHELAAVLIPHLEQKKRQGMHIIHIAAEMAPLTEAGSVALHVTNLGRALQRKNNFVEVILPKYRYMDLTQVHCLQDVQADFYSYFGGQWHRNKIWTGVIYGIAVTFIESFHPNSFFDREQCHGYDDDFERFTYFCRASLDYLVKSGKRPDILHLHNWQTASVAPMFWDIFVNQGLQKTRILFSCYNFEVQGVQEPRKLGLCGLVPEQLHRPDRLQDNFDPKLVNLLKAGIVYSNKVVISCTPLVDGQMLKVNCHGLESTLSIHKEKVVNIPYGLDDMEWDPGNDSFLPSTFSVEDLSGKALCKAALRRRVGLFEDNASTPMVGCVCLDATHDDLIFVKLALKFAIQNGAQFVLLGTGKNPIVQSDLQELKQAAKVNYKVIDEYDEGLLHLVIAGSDIMACTRPHDPLHQISLKSIKYGTIPITKRDNTMSVMFHTLFSNEPLSLAQILRLMREDPLRWSELIKNMMLKDISWDADCVHKYIDAYWSIHRI